MRTFSDLIFGILLWSIPSFVWAQGYDKTKWGMDLNQVIEAYKSAKWVDDPTLSAKNNGSISYTSELATTPPIPIIVTFDFVNNKLGKVTIIPNPNDGESAITAGLIAPKALEKKYGVPWTDTTKNLMHTGTRVWHLTDTLITSLFTAAPNKYRFSIIYEPKSEISGL